jgi:tetratricopeptide (TPR) repeat protein
MLNCGKCGASVTTTAIFCSMCGVRLNASEADLNEKKSNSPLTKASSALAKASGLSKTQSSSRSRLIFLSSSLAAGLLLLGGTYFFYRNQNAGGNSPVLNFVAPLDKLNQALTEGRQSFDQGDVATAIQKFEQAKNLSPSNTAVHLSLARAYDSAGQVDNALTAFSRVIELDAKNNEARFQRGMIMLTRGAWKEAFNDLDYLTKYAGGTEQGNRANQILASFKTNRPTEPITPEVIARTIQKRTRRGVQLPEINGIAPSLALTLPKLANDAPNSFPSVNAEESVGAGALAQNHKSRGTNYLGSKMYSSALNELQSAHSLTPDDPDINYLIGQAYSGMKKYSLARQYYEKCDSGTYYEVARRNIKIAKDREQEEAKKLSKKTRKEEKTDE